MSKLEFLYEDEAIEVSIEKTDNGLLIKSENDSYRFESISENLFYLYYNGNRHLAAVAKKESTYFIDIDSMLFEIEEPSDDGFAGAGGGHAGEKDKIYAPMPGKIVKILVEVGEAIVEKQPMVIVEAMKMENQVNAKAVGTVKAINFADGDQVDTESPIIELELADKK